MDSRPQRAGGEGSSASGAAGVKADYVTNNAKPKRNAENDYCDPMMNIIFFAQHVVDPLRLGMHQNFMSGVPV